MEPRFALEIRNLSKIDLLEIDKDVIAGTRLTLRAVDQGEERYGEPATVIALVTLGVTAFQSLVVWLVRRKVKFEITETEAVTLPDGTKVERVIQLTATGSGPPDPAVLEQVRKLPGVDAKAMAKALAGLPGSDT